MVNFWSLMVACRLQTKPLLLILILSTTSKLVIDSSRKSSSPISPQTSVGKSTPSVSQVVMLDWPKILVLMPCSSLESILMRRCNLLKSTSRWKSGDHPRRTSVPRRTSWVSSWPKSKDSIAGLKDSPSIKIIMTISLLINKMPNCTNKAWRRWSILDVLSRPSLTTRTETMFTWPTDATFHSPRLRSTTSSSIKLSSIGTPSTQMSNLFTLTPRNSCRLLKRQTNNILLPLQRIHNLFPKVLLSEEMTPSHIPRTLTNTGVVSSPPNLTLKEWLNWPVPSFTPLWDFNPSTPFLTTKNTPSKLFPAKERCSKT